MDTTALRMEDVGTLVYPGSVLSSDIVDGAYSIINVQRRPSMISIDIIGNPSPDGPEVSELVDDLGEVSQYLEAYSKLLNRNTGAPAGTDIRSSAKVVRGKAELNARLDASIGLDLEELVGFPLGVGAGLSAKEKYSEVSYLYSGILEQIFYTIVVSGDSPQSLFVGDVPSDALLVRSVGYGRLSMLTVSSNESAADAELAYNALLGLAKDGLTVGASVDASADTSATVSNHRWTFRALGGRNINASAVKDADSFRRYVEDVGQSASEAGAKPIRYHLVYAADLQNAHIGGLGADTAPRCVKAKVLEVELVSITPTIVQDGTDLAPDEELYGSVRVENKPGVQVNPAEDNPKYIWDVDFEHPKNRVQLESIDIGKSLVFNRNALTGGYDKNVQIKFNIKDKIESGPEWVGASDQAKKDEYVRYYLEDGTQIVEVKETDIEKNNGKQMDFYLYESGAEIRVTMKFTLK